jgi:LysM repeat protein
MTQQTTCDCPCADLLGLDDYSSTSNSSRSPHSSSPTRSVSEQQERVLQERVLQERQDKAPHMHVDSQERDFTEHTIVKGDTVQGICLRYKVTAAELRQVNPCFRGKQLIWGGQVKIPTTTRRSRCVQVNSLTDFIKGEMKKHDAVAINSCFSRFANREKDDQEQVLSSWNPMVSSEYQPVALLN